MKISYDFLARGDFQKLWARIMTTPTDQKASYWLGRLNKKLDTVRKGMVDVFHKEVAQVFGEKNEDGTFKAPSEPVEGYFFENGVMVPESKKEDYRQALVKLGSTEVEIDMEPLPRDYLSDIKVSPVEQDILDVLFEDLAGGGDVSQIARIVDRGK